MRKASGGMFNNAAQMWNHTFYWNCLAPKAGGEPGGRLADAINKGVRRVRAVQGRVHQASVGTFGSGWAWLVKSADKGLATRQHSNAGTPITGSDRPLLTCDVWEHAYYIDYRNARPEVPRGVLESGQLGLRGEPNVALTARAPPASARLRHPARHERAAHRYRSAPHGRARAAMRARRSLNSAGEPRAHRSA